MINVPEYIYLQVGDEHTENWELEDVDFDKIKHGEGVTWCWHRIHKTDLRYKLIKAKEVKDETI